MGRWRLRLSVDPADADLLHRSETELVIRAEISDEVPQGAIWLPILHNQGAAQRLLGGGRAVKASVRGG